MSFFTRSISVLIPLHLVFCPPAESSSARVALPGVVLWAWERPEHLQFIDPGRVAVAYLAKSIAVTERGLSVRSRMQPLGVPEGTSLIAVVRLSTARRSAPSLLVSQTGGVVAEILGAARIKGCRGVQIDFDAKKSERAFFRVLLAELRKELPDSLSLSITALASWCLDDNWIADLPVDDAVPMLFRLGPDRRAILRRLASGRDFSSPVCRQSMGLSLDEPFPRFGRTRRIYAFNPHSWTQESYSALMKDIAR